MMDFRAITITKIDKQLTIVMTQLIVLQGLKKAMLLIFILQHGADAKLLMNFRKTYINGGLKACTSIYTIREKDSTKTKTKES